MIRFTRMLTLILAVVAFALVAGPAVAQDWYWIGGTSTNWSDMANWNDTEGGGSATPSSTDDLQDQDLVLLTDGTHLPSNQDIAPLEVNKLMFTSALDSFELYGQPIQINGIIDTHSLDGDPSVGQRISFYNDLILNSSTAWIIDDRVTVALYGAVSETGGPRSFACNQGGRVELRGPVTITGG